MDITRPPAQATGGPDLLSLRDPDIYRPGHPKSPSGHSRQAIVTDDNMDPYLRHRELSISYRAFCCQNPSCTRTRNSRASVR
jgi:hypothetical protein